MKGLRFDLPLAAQVGGSIVGLNISAVDILVLVQRPYKDTLENGCLQVVRPLRLRACGGAELERRCVLAGATREWCWNSEAFHQLGTWASVHHDLKKCSLNEAASSVQSSIWCIRQRPQYR